MNCSPSVSVALLLLALTSGAFLLYVVKKESLGLLFKSIAWLVIVVAIGSLICFSMRCVMHGCMVKKECRMQSFGEGNCHEGMGRGGMRHIMIMKGGEESCERREECCEEMEEHCKEMKGCESEGEDDCCAKAKKCEMEKDTVVVVKKK